MSELDDFQSLFLCDIPLIDVRAPIEFAKGSLPSAVNLPLLDDSERAAVGICYRRSGQAAAERLGHELVCGSVKAERIEAWQAFARRHPRTATGRSFFYSR